MMATGCVTMLGRCTIDPRSTRAWRRLVTQVTHEEPTCWLQLDGCTQATTGDDVIHVTDRPDFDLVRSNIQGACSPCNQKRGNLPITALAADRDQRPAALAVCD